jgi:hypothetical protein
MRTSWLSILALGIGCSSIAGPEADIDLAVTADVDVPFALKVGERAFVEQTGIHLRFLEVANDSRCPSNALILCVWEGDGAIVVEVVHNGEYELTDTLHTTLDPKVLDLGSGILELQRLEPYPKTVTPILPEEYVATLVVRRPD